MSLPKDKAQLLLELILAFIIAGLAIMALRSR